MEILSILSRKSPLLLFLSRIWCSLRFSRKLQAETIVWGSIYVKENCWRRRTLGYPDRSFPLHISRNHRCLLANIGLLSTLAPDFL